MILRPYQKRAVQMLRERHADRPLLSIPTGGGKTSIAAEVIRSAVARGRRAVFLVHRRELVDQAVDRLAQFEVQAGRILAGHPEERHLSVQVASIPTLARRKHWPADLVIVDECSHATSDSWAKVIGRYEQATVIGLTATPIRLDGRGLGDIFGCIVEPVTTEELIAQGHLVRPEVFAPPVDLRGVKTRAGDYSIPEVVERMDKLTGSITRTWLERARGQRTVVFACNVDHSERIVEAFCQEGVRAAHIDGGTATAQRAETLAMLRAGELDLVSNVMVLSEGWDLPALQCAILARPTKSLALFRQMVGRVMRPPGPVTVLDHAGNHHEHGPVTDHIEWSLETRPKRPPVEPLTTCSVCFAVYPPGAEVCPACGAAKPMRAEAEEPPVHAPGELVKFTKDDEREWYGQQCLEASAKGYKLGWARARFKDRFGRWPRLRPIEETRYRCPGHEWEAKEYGPRSVVRCALCLCPKTERRDFDNRPHSQSLRTQKERPYLAAEIIRLRADEGLGWKEIGERFGHSASWCYQIAKKAIGDGQIESIASLGYQWAGDKYVADKAVDPTYD